MNPPSRQKIPRHGVSVSQHSVLCRNSGTRNCAATRLCARDKGTLSPRCGAVLLRNREGHARATDRARRAHLRQTRLGARNKACTPRLGAHDRGILSQQRFLGRNRLLTMIKKKKDHLGLGPHSMVSEPRFINT